jgi:proteasome alpha subunit
MGVALILGGIDNDNKCQLFLTDPSGTYISYDAVAIGSGSDQVTEFLEKNYKYISYDAVAIGSGSDQVTEFLEKNYKSELSLEDASVLAAASIYLASEDKEGTQHIRMAQIKSDTKQFELIPEKLVENFAKLAKEKYPAPNN